MIDAQLRIMRFMYAAFLFVMIMQAYVLRIVRKPPVTEMESTLLFALGGMGVLLLIISQSILRMKLSVLKEGISLHEGNMKLRAQWQAFFVINLAVNEAAYLFGWVLCFMGAPVEKVGLLMGAAFLSQLS